MALYVGNSLPLKKEKTNQRLSTRGWYFGLTLNIILVIFLGITLAVTNIERTDTNFFINTQQNTIREKLSLRAKLEVERERLLSPYELRLKAEKLGMKEPKPGQIRRIQITNQDMQAAVKKSQ